MAIATATQFYATSAEADVFLVLKEDWLDLDDDVKDDALLSARYYIDLNFDCVIDYLAISEEVKFANSLLAYDYFIQGDLFFDNDKSVLKKLVKAGSVESETEYGYAKSKRPNSLTKVVGILKTVCNHSKSGLTRV